MKNKFRKYCPLKNIRADKWALIRPWPNTTTTKPKKSTFVHYKSVFCWCYKRKKKFFLWLSLTQVKWFFFFFFLNNQITKKVRINYYPSAGVERSGWGTIITTEKCNRNERSTHLWLWIFQYFQQKIEFLFFFSIFFLCCEKKQHTTQRVFDSIKFIYEMKCVCYTPPRDKFIKFWFWRYTNKIVFF